jgi:RNA polymerase-interacting CarD/CdnL/TRCF family regulator
LKQDETRGEQRMSLELIVIVSNTLVVFATFLATLYRIKIERDQIQTVKKNVKAKECLEALRKYIKTERKLITSMSKEELQEFLDYLERLGK